MSELGKLTSSSPDDLSYLTGHIQTIDGRTAIELDGDPKLLDQKRPSHRITTRARDRSVMQIGSAWLKTARHGPQSGKLFFTLQIDFPERPSPLNVAAFLDEAIGDWIIVWRRRTVKGASAA